MGSGLGLQESNPQPLMSALGQKQTSAWRSLMSALPPKADIAECDRHVRFVPLTSDLRLDAPQQSLLRYSMRPAAAI
jgi:hypothetical protein